METGLFCPPVTALATHKEGNFEFSISPDSFSTIIAKAFFWYLEKVSNEIRKKVKKGVFWLAYGFRSAISRLLTCTSQKVAGPTAASNTWSIWDLTAWAICLSRTELRKSSWTSNLNSDPGRRRYCGLKYTAEELDVLGCWRYSLFSKSNIPIA